MNRGLRKSHPDLVTRSDSVRGAEVAVEVAAAVAGAVSNSELSIDKPSSLPQLPSLSSTSSSTSTSDVIDLNGSSKAHLPLPLPLPLQSSLSPPIDLLSSELPSPSHCLITVKEQGHRQGQGPSQGQGQGHRVGEKESELSAVRYLKEKSIKEVIAFYYRHIQYDEDECHRNDNDEESDIQKRVQDPPSLFLHGQQTSGKHLAYRTILIIISNITKIMQNQSI